MITHLTVVVMAGASCWPSCFWSELFVRHSFVFSSKTSKTGLETPEERLFDEECLY
jgi:hypothetical protein